jgi:glutathione S-transferase
MTDIEIFSHPLCPHAQRLVLVGLVADKVPGKDFKLTYLDYATLRQTSRLHSGSGELPVLKLDGQPVSTSADAIAEYLDAVLGAGLLPAAPLERLRVRGGERLVSNILDRMRTLFVARDVADLDASYKELALAAAAIEQNLGERETPGSLADLGYVALAPLASLTGAFVPLRDHALWRATPKLKAFLEACRSDERVNRSRCPDYDREFCAFFAMTGSNFPSLIAAR